MSGKKKTDKRTAEEVGLEIIQAMDAEFHNKGDRVIAIVGAAYLDDLLGRLLAAMFVDGKDADELLGANAPLGTNKSRYQLAHCLGLIRKDQRDDLDTIGRIRNVFAHNFKVRSFDDPDKVRNLCGNLKQPELFAAMASNVFPNDNGEKAAERARTHVRETTKTPRQKFETTVVILFGSLLRRLNLISRADCHPWFSSDPDPVFPTPFGAG